MAPPNVQQFGLHKQHAKGSFGIGVVVASKKGCKHRQINCFLWKTHCSILPVDEVLDKSE